MDDAWHIPGQKTGRDKRYFYSFLEKTLFWWAEKWAVKLFTDRTIVLSRWVKKLVDEKYGVESVVLHTGTEKQPLVMAKPSKVFTFLYFGILLPHRNLEMLIKAFSKLSKKHKAQLILAGSGKTNPKYAKKVAKLVRQAKLPVKLLQKEFTDEEVKRLLAACDVFVFPPRRQTWGMIVTEAMMSAKPCIVTASAGVSDILQDSRNALLFEENNIDDLYQKMRQLYLDKARRENLGREARKTILKHPSWDEYVDLLTFRRHADDGLKMLE